MDIASNPEGSQEGIDMVGKNNLMPKTGQQTAGMALRPTAVDAVAQHVPEPAPLRYDNLLLFFRQAGIVQNINNTLKPLVVGGITHFFVSPPKRYFSPPEHLSQAPLRYAHGS